MNGTRAGGANSEPAVTRLTHTPVFACGNKGNTMRTLLIAAMLALVVLAGASPAAAATPRARAEFDADDVVVENVRSYHKLTVDGCSTVSDVGAPDLPIRVLHFVIPGDARVDDVVISSLEERELTGVYRVLPRQPEVPMGEVAPWVDPDPAIYGSDSTYPASRVRLLGEGYLGGYRIATVAVYPVTYAPASGRLMLATDLSLELELEPAANRAHPRHRMTARADRTYRELVETMVENPSEVAGKLSTVVDVGGAAVPEGFAPRYSPSLEGSPVEYVIVTNEALAPHFQELADWKTAKGVPAVVKTITWIEDNYPGGSDTAERIRLFLKDAFASWGTTYVLLGGDTQIVPVRLAHTSYYGGALIPCDLYYSDLDGNWNADGDDVFGEAYHGIASPGDSTDLYPDVFVGRAPVNDVVQLEAFLTKTLSYERSPEPAFTDRNLFLAEVVFPYDWETGPYSLDGASDIIEPLLPLVPSEIDNIRLYANVEEFPDAYPLAAAAAIDSINAGYNLVVHVGHGNKDIIRVGTSNYITMADADAFSNGDARASFMWLLNCTSAAIDYDSIAERIVTNPAGGAAAVFGPTRYSFPATMSDYLHSWIEILYSGSAPQAGVVSALAKAEHASEEVAGYENPNRWTQFSTVLLGDPELPIWRGRPLTLDAMHTNQMDVGDSGLLVTVTDPAPVDGALVCARRSGEVYAYGLTGPGGDVFLDVTPHTTGTITLTVTAPGYLPHESSVAVLPTDEAHVYLLSHAVDDGPDGASDGNGNGKAEPGETLAIDIALRNSGTIEARGLTAMLTSSDPFIEILTGETVVGDLAAGATTAVADAFSVAVDPACPNEHDVTFSVEFDEFGDPGDGSDNGRFLPCDGEGRGAWTQQFVVRIFRADLAPLYLFFDDSAGDGDGRPEPGETVDLEIQIWNDGNGDTEGVVGTLRYGHHSVTIVDSTAAWTSIPAGTIAPSGDAFRFFVNQGIVDSFDLVLEDGRGLTWTHTIDVDPPDMPEDLTVSVKGTTIGLSWNRVLDSDLRGYDVHRSENAGGPFERANDALVEGSALFSDSGLAENTLYHYYVTAVDRSGNVGPASAVLSVSTNPPSQAGWPLGTSGGMYSSPAVADIDGDGELEVVVASDEIYAWNADGTEVTDGDGDPRTGGILATDGTGGYRCSPAIGEIDGDAGAEIVAAAWANVGSGEESVFELFVWNGEDGSVLPGWPVAMGSFCWGSPALFDLDSDGHCEIIIPCADGYLYCWRYDGQEFVDGDGDPHTTGVLAWLGSRWAYGSPAVADLDGDQEPEIIQASMNDSVYAFHTDGTRVDGWPVYVRDRSLCSPAVGDVDNDGDLEVVVGSNYELVWLLDGDGTVMDGWPQDNSYEGDFPPSPVLADLEGDGTLEIVLMGSDGALTVRDYEGGELPGWPQQLEDGSWSSPAVADIDGDPGMEIVVGCTDGRLYCFDADGGLLSGWPIQTDAEIFGSPAVADLDGDGDVEVVVGGMDTNVYVWDCEGAYDDGENVLWGQFLHDAWRTQASGFVVLTGVEDDWQGERTLVLEQNSPNPFNPVTTIAFTVPQTGGGVAHARLSIYSVDGSLVRILVDGPVDAGRRSVVWDGRDGTGRPAASGIYFYRLTVGSATDAKKMTLIK